MEYSKIKECRSAQEQLRNNLETIHKEGNNKDQQMRMRKIKLQQ